MLQVSVDAITPDDSTAYLVGPEGLVWVQPAIGDAHIVAARTDEERAAAERYIAELLDMGLVPYGMPLNQRQIVAMFGGPWTRDCRWVHWQDAPEPAGDPGDDLPTHAGVVR